MPKAVSDSMVIFNIYIKMIQRNAVAYVLRMPAFPLTSVIGRGRILAQGSIEDVRGLCRNRFKATFGDDSRAMETIYGQTRDEVLARLQGQQVAEYSLTRTSLEDLYLELTGDGFEVDAEKNTPPPQADTPVLSK